MTERLTLNLPYAPRADSDDEYSRLINDSECITVVHFGLDTPLAADARSPQRPGVSGGSGRPDLEGGLVAGAGRVGVGVAGRVTGLDADDGGSGDAGRSGDQEAGPGAARHADQRTVREDLDQDADQDAYGLDTLTRGLAGLHGVEKYLLLNARFHGPERFRAERLQALAAVLDWLRTEAGLTGIVYADAYFLRALDKAGGSLSGKLCAVPSVNCCIDSPEKAGGHLDLIASTSFAPPPRLVLDRWLNRDLAALERVGASIRARWPGLRLELLANEGCLAFCPFKPAHDALLAACHLEGRAPDTHGLDTYGLNREYGCLDLYRREPWRIFASPFIRPEDQDRYAGLVDGIKLGGRNRGGPGHLARVARAYVQKRFEGNLLDLLDTLGEFQDRLLINNASLPSNLFSLLAGCAKQCGRCSVCRELARVHVRTQEAGPGRLDGEVRP